MTNINGFINLYKEQDYTSNDAVNIVRGIFRGTKTGHTGTLDPMATGVLPICLGKATKLADYVQAETKVYRTSLKLGLETDTYDIWGKTLKTYDVNLTEEEITAALLSFTGEQEQLPPMYSAIKIKGKKLYELAREGKTIERKPRKITIYSITDIVFSDSKNLSFTVTCSKGTYIRSLCYDIGRKLAAGGTMSALERVKTGGFDKTSAITIDELRALKEENRLFESVIPIEKALTGYKKYTASPAADRLLDNGNKISITEIKGEKPETNSSFLLFNSKGELAGLFKRIKNEAKPLCMLK
ncbi:MAG: tRNA pseudouridine(55) synthase TruB [Clostridiales bacterium]|nr:tRNA pseudouridine(55) synthase TruB [Clostridiales bacterium]